MGQAEEEADAGEDAGPALFREQQRLPGVTRSPPGSRARCWATQGALPKPNIPIPAERALNMSAGIFRSPRGLTNNFFAIVTERGGGIVGFGALFWFCFRVFFIILIAK